MWNEKRNFYITDSIIHTTIRIYWSRQHEENIWKIYCMRRRTLLYDIADPMYFDRTQQRLN